MNRLLRSALVAPVILASAGDAMAADVSTYEPVPIAVAPQYDERGGVRIGYLDCEIGGGVGYVLGSAKELNCVFQSTTGERQAEAYTGVMRKVGVDVGFTTAGRLVWAVFAPTAGFHTGSLSGLYEGATVEATLGAGVGANLLVGGTAGSVHLQTVSVTGQIGLNAAAAGTSVTLTAVN